MNPQLSSRDVQTIKTVILCNMQSEISYIPPELMRMFFVAMGYLPPTFEGDHNLVQIHCVDDCYKYDLPQYFPLGYTPDPIKSAENAAFNCLQICHDLKLIGCQFILRFLKTIISTRRLDLLRWMMDRKYHKGISTFTLEAVVKAGDLECVKYVAATETYIDIKNYVAAVELDRVDILEFLWSRQQYKSRGLCNTASKHGSSNCLQWLIDHDHVKDGDAVMSAVQNRHLDCLRILINNRFRVHETDAMSYAAMNDDIESMELLLPYSATNSASPCNMALQKRSITAVKWLVEHKFAMDKDTLGDATFYNGADVVRYLLENGAPRIFTGCILSKDETRMIECLKVMLEYNVSRCERYTYLLE